jgi:hypothetical protein
MLALGPFVYKLPYPISFLCAATQVPVTYANLHVPVTCRASTALSVP